MSFGWTRIERNKMAAAQRSGHDHPNQPGFWVTCWQSPAGIWWSVDGLAGLGRWLASGGGGVLILANNVAGVLSEVSEVDAATVGLGLFIYAVGLALDVWFCLRLWVVDEVPEDVALLRSRGILRSVLQYEEFMYPVCCGLLMPLPSFLFANNVGNGKIWIVLLLQNLI